MLRFAPRYGIIAGPLVRPSRQKWRPAINDNHATGTVPGPLGDERVRAALRLFAAHGLAAADQARRAAANANARGDQTDAAWWRDIGQILGARR